MSYYSEFSSCHSETCSAALGVTERSLYLVWRDFGLDPNYSIEDLLIRDQIFPTGSPSVVDYDSA
jgi:hypothetical protein